MLGTHRLKRLSLWCGLLLACLALARPAFSQTKTDDKSAPQPVVEKAIPLAVLCVSGVERWLTNVDYLFATVEREELSDFVGGQMAKVNDLKGVDKDKPFGLLIFLRPGLLPQPYPVAFAPVKNLSDLIGTAGGGPFKVKKIDDSHYDLVSDQRTFHVKLQGDYAWIAENTDQLDYEFPTPAELTKSIVPRYDIGLEFNLTSVPEGMKHIFLDFLRASTETSIQQRDGEPDGAYQLRRLNALNILDDFEQLILHGERLTLGLAVDQKTKRVAIEGEVVSKPDSPLAKGLQAVAARPSYFANLVRDDVPLTFSMSWMMPAPHQKRLGEFFDTAEQEASSQFTNVLAGKEPREAQTPPPAEPVPATSSGKPKRGAAARPKKPKLPVPPPIKDIFDSLRATASTGHLDFFLQFLADGPKDDPPKFTFIGGAKLSDGVKLAGGATEVMKQIEGKVKLTALELHKDSHNGVTFHRLVGPENDRGQELMYGGKPSLYLGLGPQAIWFAIGGPEALTHLKLAIDKVQGGPDERPTTLTNTPLQFTMRMNRWVELGRRGFEEARDRQRKAIEAERRAAGANATEAKPADSGNRRPSPGERFMDMQRKAFSGSDDSIHVHFKPTEQGARVRVEFDEGFVRLMGYGVSAGIDAQAERQKRREERERNRDGQPKQ